MKYLITVILAIGVGFLILQTSFDSKVYKKEYRPTTTHNQLMEYLGEYYGTKDFEKYMF